jgi:hypothetical protein
MNLAYTTYMIMPDPEFVRSILDYDPQTGVIRWKVNRTPRGKAGAVAGCVRDDSYISIGIGGRMYMAHRLAFVIMTGRWPNHQIDHESTDRTDNRWENLREATHAQNLHNVGRNRANTTGFKGVYHHSDGYFGAMIQVNRTKLHLGLFKKPEYAAAAYRIASACVHGDFSRSS